jgi:hypothetical protein
MMKKITLTAIFLGLWYACPAFGQIKGIGKIALESCSVASRSLSDKASLAAFLDQYDGVAESDPLSLKPSDILEFKWVDLAGNGRCELVGEFSYGPNAPFVQVYWQHHSQVLPGWSGLKKSITDLNGDGKKEIIMDSILDPTGARGVRICPNEVI